MPSSPLSGLFLANLKSGKVVIRFNNPGLIAFCANPVPKKFGGWWQFPEPFILPFRGFGESFHSGDVAVANDSSLSRAGSDLKNVHPLTPHALLPGAYSAGGMVLPAIVIPSWDWTSFTSQFAKLLPGFVPQNSAKLPIRFIRQKFKPFFEYFSSVFIAQKGPTSCNRRETHSIGAASNYARARCRILFSFRSHGLAANERRGVFRRLSVTCQATAAVISSVVGICGSLASRSAVSLSTEDAVLPATSERRT